MAADQGIFRSAVDGCLSSHFRSLEKVTAEEMKRVVNQAVRRFI